MTKHLLILITMATFFVLAGCGEGEQEDVRKQDKMQDRFEQFAEDAGGWDGAHVPKGNKDAPLMGGQKGTVGSHKVEYKVVLTGPGSIRINYQDDAADLRRATLCADESCPANNIDAEANTNYQGQFEAAPRTGPVLVDGTWTFGYESAGRVWGVIRCTIPEEETADSVGVEMSMSVDGNVTEYLEEAVTRELPRELNLQWPPRGSKIEFKDKTG